MSEPRKHHRVPKTYLANFTDPAGRVWVYDPRSDGPRNMAPVNVSVETDLYSVIRPDGSPDTTVERALGDIENAGAPVLARVVQGTTTLHQLDGQDRYDFAALVASIYLRSDSLRQHMANLKGRLLSRAAELTISHDGAWDTFVRKQASIGKVIPPEQRAKTRAFMADPNSYELHMRKDATMTPLATLEPVTERIFNMNWSVIRAPDGEAFVSSDNPAVVMVPPGPGPAFFRGGLSSKRAEVTLPLSPQLMMFAHWREEVPATVTATRDLVRQLNRQRAGHAEQAVYAHSRSDGVWRLTKKHLGQAIDQTENQGEARVRLVRAGQFNK